MGERELREKRLTMTVLMTPDKANLSGNVHGGEMLKMLDEVAYACGSRFCGHYVVTLCVDQVVFREPVRIGELVTLLAQVNYTGRTSMEVGVKVIAEDITGRTCRHTNSCYFTMVAVEDGRSVPVGDVELENDEDEARWEAAKARREFRREVERRSQELRSSRQAR
ncbi:MAG: acyl-CoA thioesterase [Planctomycetota bacterium]|nr:acyl-CoA thioesterase [Planctomycetota bacterium]